MKLNRIPFLAALGLMTACAGRTPAPVAVVQPQDRYADCSAIMAEVHGNTRQISDLGREDGAKVAQNVVAGVTGALFILPLFLMDFQNAAGKEGSALQQRNAYLATLAENRCNGSVVAGSSPNGVVVGQPSATASVMAPVPVVAPAPTIAAARADRGPPTTN